MKNSKGTAVIIILLSIALCTSSSYGQYPPGYQKPSSTGSTAAPTQAKPKNGEDEMMRMGGITLKKEAVAKIIDRKLKTLSGYFEMLCEKSSPNVDLVINQAMALFNNDESVIVEISSTRNNKIVIRQIRQYLVNMSRLPYKSVEVKYSRIFQVENITKQPDGTYKGYVTLEQEFAGKSKEGNNIYNDVSTKTFTVIIKVTDVLRDGKMLSYLDIFFGNMKVVDTN